MKTRIMMIESVADEVTLDRDRLLKISPRAQDLDITYIYVILNEDDTDIDREDFRTRLKQEIESGRPDYILLHTGWAFFKDIKYFYSLIEECKNNYPWIKFGCQKKTDFNIDSKIFDQDQTTQSVEQKVFREILRM